LRQKDGTGRTDVRSHLMRAQRSRLSPVHQNMKHPTMRQLYRSPNGDAWFLARDPETGLAFVQHQANASSGE